VPLKPVLIEGGRYERVVRGEHEFVLVPGVAGADGCPEVPGRLVRFAGHLRTAVLVLSQANRFLDRGADRPGFVAGIAGWSIALDGVTVYCSTLAAPGAAEALVQAASALSRLLAHPVRWQFEADWRDRAVYFQGIPARITRLLAPRGLALLEAGEGFFFPPQPAEYERGEEGDGPTTSVLVDLLSDSVWWTRSRFLSSSQPAGSDATATSPSGVGDQSHE
jgi:hypothetical protein